MCKQANHTRSNAPTSSSSCLHDSGRPTWLRCYTWYTKSWRDTSSCRYCIGRISEPAFISKTSRKMHQVDFHSQFIKPSSIVHTVSSCRFPSFLHMLDYCTNVEKAFRWSQVVGMEPFRICHQGRPARTDQRMNEAKLLDGDVRNLTMNDIISSLRTRRATGTERVTRPTRL
jgi:hypothetical protein